MWLKCTLSALIEEVSQKCYIKCLEIMAIFIHSYLFSEASIILHVRNFVNTWMNIFCSRSLHEIYKPISTRVFLTWPNVLKVFLLTRERILWSSTSFVFCCVPRCFTFLSSLEPSFFIVLFCCVIGWFFSLTMASFSCIYLTPSIPRYPKKVSTWNQHYVLVCCGRIRKMFKCLMFKCPVTFEPLEMGNQV